MRDRRLLTLDEAGVIAKARGYRQQVGESLRADDR